MPQEKEDHETLPSGGEDGMRLCRSAAVTWECEGTAVRATAGAQQGQKRRLRWREAVKMAARSSVQILRACN